MPADGKIKIIDRNTVIKEIVLRLEPLNPNKIILFCSYASGLPNYGFSIGLKASEK